MKSLVLIVITAFLASHAFAQEHHSEHSDSCVKLFKKYEYTCTDKDPEIGKGFEITFANSKASLKENGVHVADLVVVSASEPTGYDEISVLTYDQHVVNGYQVILKSGGIAPITEATIFQGGFAGYSQVAVLANCK